MITLEGEVTNLRELLPAKWEVGVGRWRSIQL